MSAKTRAAVARTSEKGLMVHTPYEEIVTTPTAFQIRDRSGAVVTIGLIVLALVVGASMHLCAQGSFQNLSFENGTIIPDGSSPHSINAEAALPGWTVSYGSGPGGVNIMYNAFNLSYAAVGLHDSKSTITQPLQGNDSVMLQSSQYPFAGDSASLSQTGLVPNGTKSMVFMGSGIPGYFQVSLGGQTLSLTPLSVTSSYTLWGADISWAAGTTAALQFTVNGSQFSTLLLDGIQFSTQPAPEPSTYAMFAVGFGLLALRRHLYRCEKFETPGTGAVGFYGCEKTVHQTVSPA